MASSLSARSALQAVPDAELRDPTREELYNGPTREKLPSAIQQMASDETACTFCGVSYFVFSEVQELQATVKQYKKTFREFVRFMERERRVSQELRAQVVSLKRSLDEGVAACAAVVQQVAGESQRLRATNEQLASQLQQAQRDAGDAHRELVQQQNQWRRAEEEWKMASALTEQKLRNEILHLASQLEKCRLLSTSQEAEFLATLERERGKIKELEVLVATTRESMAAAERHVVTERDVLKQQLLAANERVEAEREMAKQLEAQLRAVQLELQRVVASSDSDRAAYSQLSGDVAALKTQLLQHEKAKAALATEKGGLREQLDQSSDLARSLRVEIAALEKKIETNVLDTEKRKQEFGRELEKIRLEHGQAINRMQRDHQRAIDELKQQQATYVEFLQTQTREAAAVNATTMHHALVKVETKLHDAEKQLAHSRRHVQETSDELQKLRMSHHQATARAQTLERQAEAVNAEKRGLKDELDKLQHQYDDLQADTTQQLERVRLETRVQLQRQFDDQQAQLQRKVDSLQTKCDQLRRENEQLVKQRQARNPEDDNDESAPRRTTHQAWDDPSSDSKGERRGSTRVTAGKSSHNNQDHHELEKLVESLRRTIDQKDKEIFLLQQTVHRECLERTSLLEKMRSGKVLPDLGPSSLSSPSNVLESSLRRSSLTPRRDQGQANGSDGDDVDDRDSGDHDPTQPKASFYERLRRAGQRKPKIRKT